MSDFPPLDPEFGAARLRRGQNKFHALGIEVGFVFGDGRENMDREAVGVGEIGRRKIEAALHQPRNHLDISREAIQPGDNKRRTKYAANPDRFVELRAIILPSAQRFGILGNQPPRMRGKEGLNSFRWASRPSPESSCRPVETR